MRSTLTYSTLGMVFLALASAGAPEKTAPCWLTNYDQARAAARRSGKPIFLVFR
jgi:hypothetical protein